VDVAVGFLALPPPEPTSDGLGPLNVSNVYAAQAAVEPLEAALARIEASLSAVERMRRRLGDGAIPTAARDWLR